MPFHTNRRAKIKQALTVQKPDKDVEKLGPSYTAGAHMKAYSYLGK